MASVGMPDSMMEIPLTPSPPAASRKKSWEELRQAVRKSRRMATSLLNRVPHTFTFRRAQSPLGEQIRLYFLGVPVGSRENTLLYLDLPIEPQPPGEDDLEWRTLLNAFHATPWHGKFSKEEQLLRERKRLASFGITSYDYCDKGGTFVFSACNSLFMCTDSLGEEGFVSCPVFPLEVKSNHTSSRMDPKLCPQNPQLLAYVCNGDLWVTNVSSGHEHRLTFAHKGSSSLADDPHSAGVPSFVVQEEFDRYTGYWWQPKCPTEQGHHSVYRILYEEVDESDVEILNIVSASNESKDCDEYRYPRAGTPNAKCNLKLIEFRIDNTGRLADLVDKQLCEPLHCLFPWMEYLVRAGWTPDGKHMYAQLLDRLQQKLQLVIIPLESFTSAAGVTDDEKIKDRSYSSSVGTDIQVIYEDTSDIWINVHDVAHFLPQETPDEISFIWTSEKSGFRHLYFVKSAIQLPTSGSQDSMDTLDNHTASTYPTVLQEVALTQGDWEVSGKQIWVSESRRLVYFLGHKDTALESHLYVVSYENPGSVVRLTELGYSHSVSLDKDCEMFVTVCSSIRKPPASQVFRIAFIEDGQIVPQAIGALLPQIMVSEEYIAPELFTLPTTLSQCERQMYGMVYKPRSAERGKCYPTVVFVYGGPQVQLVNNSYKGIRYLRLQTLATLGYTVVVFDGRGSCHRGLHFEGHVQNKLGTVEIADQVQGLEWVASHIGYVDLNRVAIHGWSYGGYLSLMGLVQRPDVFKVAVAGAPVTSWRLYDTGYTERYLGLPQTNQIGYKEGSVLDYIDKFPTEENRLLIVHGLIDENVHFQHTSALVTALVKACKPYQLQVYPNERHGIRNPEASEHYETMLLSFLQQHL